MKEIWKEIVGFEDSYEVSNHGRLKSFKKDTAGRVLKNTNKKGGYLSVVLQYNGKTRYVRMHALVAEAFIGPRPSNKHHVHHKDGNKQNNHVSNLEYVTVKEHALITVQQIPSMLDGMKKWNTIDRPIPILQFSLDGDFIAEYKNGSDASKATGVCRRNILQVANKTEYKPGLVRSQAGGYKWKFKK